MGGRCRCLRVEERLKPRRVRAMSITIHSGLKTKILEAQGKASKDLKALAEWLRGLETHFEQRNDGGIYFFDHFQFIGSADKMYHDLRDLYWWPGMKRDVAEYVSRTCNGRFGHNFWQALQEGWVQKTTQEYRLNTLIPIGSECGVLSDAGIYASSLCYGFWWQLGYSSSIAEFEAKRSHLSIDHWNFGKEPEYTWEHEDQFRKKYPHLFSETVPPSGVQPEP
ncbi:putative reverse transcriptase domain-containing protein [Tanacetum coccineum]